MKFKKLMNHLVNTTKISLQITLLCFTLVQNLYADTPESFSELPATARVWENRSGVEGSGYSDMIGPDVAFLNDGWYYRNDSGWYLFYEGPTLNFDEADSQYTQALQYEVFSGTAFSGDGTPGMYEFMLEGATGNLITASGMNFNPQGMEKLKDASGATVYYNLENNTWWNITNMDNALTNIPKAPYKPLALNSGTVPSSALFGSNPQTQLVFDIPSRRYFYSSGSSIAAFHSSIANSYRRWNNNSGVEGSGYSNMSGRDIVYVNGVWYEVEDETHYNSFSEGRYLDFAVADASLVEALQYELITGTSLEDKGLPSELNLKLDGETGQLLNSAGVPVLTSEGKDVTPTIIFRDTLVLQGVKNKNKSRSNNKFKPILTEVKLLRVVPLVNSANDPFNDRTLPTAISNALNPNSVVSAPPTTPAPVSACPLNTTLTVLATLPSGSPISNTINLDTTSPYNLNTGNFINVPISVDTQLDLINGTVKIGSGFTFVSGSSLGSVAEGTNLSYLVRRNSDSFEFEINFRFKVDIVFDSTGIIFETLTGRLCKSGGAT